MDDGTATRDSRTGDLDLRAAATASSDEPPPARLMIFARHALTRFGLQALIGTATELFVVEIAASIDEAEDALQRGELDLLLASWADAERAAVGQLAEAANASGVPLLLIGEAPAPEELHALLPAGARGFLLPEATGDELAAAVRSLLQGLVVLEPTVAHALGSAGPIMTGSIAGLEEPLTEREREVLQLMASGLPNKAIASRLRISEHTVKFHVGSILAKLDAGSRTEAVTRAARRGLLVL